MRSLLFSALVAAASLLSAPAQAQEQTCPPAPYERAALETLKQNEFVIASARERRRFAQSITVCLASPDPALRDGIAYEALSTLLRARQLDVATQTTLALDLMARLHSDDPQGFERPFAALALSEIVRAERLNSHFTDSMRADVLNRSLEYFIAMRDYRGFDEAEGWRHGVAHGADLLMQLAFNEAYARADLIAIRDALSTQIAPPGHFYIYGESARLARPILIIAHRGIFDEAEWSAWFEAIAAPAPLNSWNEAFSSQAGLAKRHNTNAFLLELYASASLAQDPNIRALLPGVEAALRAMP